MSNLLGCNASKVLYRRLGYTVVREQDILKWLAQQIIEQPLRPRLIMLIPDRTSLSSRIDEMETENQIGEESSMEGILDQVAKWVETELPENPINWIIDRRSF